MTNDFSEDTLVEQPAIALFAELGYETPNCFHEKVGTTDSALGRETTEEVVLVPKLRMDCCQAKIAQELTRLEPSSNRPTQAFRNKHLREFTFRVPRLEPL